MTIKYDCRICHTRIGELNQEQVTEAQLGLHFLTVQERQEMVSSESDGSMTVHVVCETCQEALDAHPELALVGNPLQ